MRSFTKIHAAILTLVILFSGSFYVFYVLAQRKLPKPPLILTPNVINQPLPAANLVDASGKSLSDAELRHGKVVLIFSLVECQPCDKENEFLKTVIGMRNDVKFFYVLPFGNKENALKAAQAKYAGPVFYDDRSTLSKSLEVYQVPIKLFVEDGVMKKTWLDATVDAQTQSEFKDWLRGL